MRRQCCQVVERRERDASSQQLLSQVVGRTRSEYGIELQGLDDLRDLDALVLSVPHRAYLDMPSDELVGRLRSGGVLIDVRSAIPPEAIPAGVRAWSL